MNENNLKKIMNDHDADKEQIRQSVLSAALSEEKQPSGRKFRRAVVICAAVLLLVSGFTVYAVAAEAKEYNEAVGFFDENNIPTDGLSRAEIKAVYRDVTMKTYSYEKTIEILNAYSVEVYSETLESPTNAELDELWNERVLAYTEQLHAQSGIWYDVEYEDAGFDSNGIGHSVQYVVRKDGENVIWRYRVPDDMDYLFVDESIISCTGGVVVIGSTGGFGTWEETPCAIMLNDDGELLWRYDDAKKCFSYQTACDCGDAVALFGGGAGNGEYGNIYTLIGKDGEVQINKVEMTDRYLRFGAAVRTGDHYLAKVFDGGWKLISVTQDGEKTEKYDYSVDGVPVTVRDIISFGGKVYLSAEKQDEELTYGDLAQDEEALLRFFKENYTAILLETGDDGTVRKAFEVKNVRPGTLSEDEDGNLRWQIIRYDKAGFAPLWMNSHIYEFDCTEFSFVFGEDGKLKEKVEVGYYPDAY